MRPHEDGNYEDPGRLQYEAVCDDREGLAKRCREVENLLLGMIGLIDLLSHNTSIPAHVRNDMKTNHRYVDAIAFGAVASSFDEEVKP